MSDIRVSNEGVIKIMKGLNPSKALGPDELYPRVLKELVIKLRPVFVHLFQQSLDKGDIPRNGLWLTSIHFIRRWTELYQVTVVPERIICTNIMAHFDKHMLLSDRQHAFKEEP